MAKNYTALLIVFLFGSSLLYAQPFQKELPGVLLFNIKQLPSGDLVVGGQNAAGNQIYAGRYTRSGAIVYNKTIKPASGGITFDPMHNRDIMLLDGDSLVFNAWSSGTLGTHNLVAKTDLQANPGWWKVYRNDGTDFTPRGGGGGLYKTSTSHYINAAWSHHHQGGAFDYGAHIQKTDLVGNPLWSIHFSNTGFVFLYAATEGANGDYSFIGGSSSILTINTTPDGVPNWIYTYKVGTGANEATGILPTSDNGYILAGSHPKPSAPTDRDAFIMKLDQSGNVVWAKAIGGTGNDFFYNVRSTADGGFIACGKTNSYGMGSDDGLLVKFSAAGDVEWAKAVGTSNAESINDVIQDGDFYYGAGGVGAGGLLVAVRGSSRLGCGETLITPAVIDETALVVRTARTYPTVDFVQTVNDPATSSNLSVEAESLCSLDTTSVNGQICPGDSYSFNGETLTQPGTYYQSLVSSVTGRDSIVKLVLSLYDLPQPAITQNGNVLSTTQAYSSYQWLHNGSAISGATFNNHTITQGGNYTVQVVSTDGCTNTSPPFNVTATGGINEAELFPNPAREYVTVRLPELVAGVYITIISSESKKLISEYHAYTNSIRIDIRHLPEGTYLLRLKSINGSKKSFLLIKGK